MPMLIPTRGIPDRNGEQIDFDELLCGHYVDNDPGQRFATSFARNLLHTPPGILQLSNFLLVGTEGAGISTLLREMLAGRIADANLAGPSVLRVRLSGNQSATQILRSIACAQDNRLGIPTSRTTSSGVLQEAIVKALTNRQIRVLVIFEGDLAVTMGEESAQKAMTVLNALLVQANCCAIVHTSPTAVDRFYEGEIGSRIFRKLEMSGFLSVAETERFGRNWDDAFSTTRWGGLPWGGSVGTRDIAKILFHRTDRTLSKVTDEIKSAVIRAQEAQEELDPKHFK